MARISIQQVVGRGGFATLALVVLCFAWPVFAQQVVAVPTAKTLQLQDGTVVRLAALQAPNRGRSAAEADDLLAKEAHATLEALALGKEVRLEPISTDRRERLVAMAYVDGAWLQAEMLRAGMGWVYSFADTRAYARDLLAAEHEAERAKRGVWAQPAYAVLDVAEAASHLSEFRLVRGTVADVAEVRGTYYVNFGADWKTDFTLQVSKSDAKAFDADWLISLKGKTLRVRGWLFEKNGPAMELTHPEQVEILL